MHLDRASGILLHITSLPGPFGVGDLGPVAHAFVDFLAGAGQRVWQVLPLVPVGHGDSPYASPSTFAGNSLFISPETLLEEGLLTAADLEKRPTFPADAVDYQAVSDFKRGLLRAAYRQFRSGGFDRLAERFEGFRRNQSHWLPDYALFMALKEAHEERAWTSWPRPLAEREPEAIASAKEKLSDSVALHEFAQFLFEDQWQRLKKYAGERGIRIFGDLPIYVAHDSADVWAHPELFHLEADGTPSVVAGVPPDYFSETGQRWGNPIYRWDLMHQHGYDWWLQRFARSFELVDLLRLDHFRGFQAYWEIPASEPTAVNGRWVLGPGAALFYALKEQMGNLPIVAEDLGLITPDVTALIEELALPGMAVLHFAFGGGSESSYLPHNFKKDLVAYTGTHDNDTSVGWWRARARAATGSHEARERDFATQYLDLNDHDSIHRVLIRWLMASVCALIVIPMQDVLGLGGEARMNVPGRESGNWRWRMQHHHLSEEVAAKMLHMSRLYGRV